MGLEELLFFWLETQGYEPEMIFGKIVVFSADKREVYFRVKDSKVYVIAYMRNKRNPYRGCVDAHRPDFFETITGWLKRWR